MCPVNKAMNQLQRSRQEIDSVFFLTTSSTELRKTTFLDKDFGQNTILAASGVWAPVISWRHHCVRDGTCNAMASLPHATIDL